MKNLILLGSLVVLASCGRVERPQEFFDITGDSGSDGQSCFSEQVEGGVNVICGDTTHFVINGQDGTNGNDGDDGQDGQDGTFEGSIEYVEICRGNSSANYIETVLKLDGKFMAFLASSDYKRERLVLLVENETYRTTDGREKLFSIVNGEINCL